MTSTSMSFCLNCPTVNRKKEPRTFTYLNVFVYSIFQNVFICKVNTLTMIDVFVTSMLVVFCVGLSLTLTKSCCHIHNPFKCIVCLLHTTYTNSYCKLLTSQARQPPAKRPRYNDDFTNTVSNRFIAYFDIVITMYFKL